MELSDYTDQQIQDELRRRREEKIRNRKIRNDNYIYWKGVVTSINDNSWGDISTRFKFRVEGDGLGGGYYTLLAGMGFNQKNMPKIGDNVLLRYKNGFGYTCNINHSKIVEITI